MKNVLKKTVINLCRCFYKRRMRLLNKNTSCTIISQNCIGGVIYSNLGVQFNSPTINLFIEDENFVKLVESLDYYMSLDAEILCDDFVDPIDNTVHYPKISIDDIEICCLHYASGKEAADAWNKRRKRVNLDNVYVIGNTWNMHNNAEYVKRLLNSKYKTVVFSTKECECEGTIPLPGDFWSLDSRSIVRPNITDIKPGSYKKYFEEFFDYVSWLNE